jgi:hypothetical protein
MPTLNAARESVYQRFADEWASAGQTEPYTFELENYDPPAGPWLAVSVQHVASSQETLGRATNRRFRRSAVITVYVYDLVNQGRRSIDLLAQTARNIFEGVSFDSLDCGNAVAREIPSDGRYYGMLIATSFDYDEIK